MILDYRIRLCPVLPLSSPSLWIWENLGNWTFCLTKILCKKLYLRTYCELDLHIFIVFLFKYYVIIIKMPYGCSFGKKVEKFWKIILKKFEKIWKNKNYLCLVSSLEFLENVGSLGGGLDNVEYCISIWILHQNIIWMNFYLDFRKTLIFYF